MGILARCVDLRVCVVACVNLKAWKYQNRLDGRLLAVSLRVVKLRFLFVVRAERTVRFYTLSGDLG